jgi:CRP-like cAMP-binding protein
VEIDIDVVMPPPPAPGALPAIPLFSSLSKDELVTVLSSAMEVRAFAAGEVVVAEGTPGDSMFALSEGTASVYRGYNDPKTKRKVAEVATGDIFGEAAMVSGAPRLATVVVETDAVALEFRRDAMARVIAKHGQVGQKIDQFYRERLLANVLRASPILRGLQEADKKALARSFQAVTFVDGQRIINEGQSPDSVYLLLRGRCAASHATGDRYPDLKEGDLFGEVSVLLDGPATASVSALGPVLALRLGAREFKDRVLKDAGAMLAVKKMAQVRLGRTALFNEEIAEEQSDSRV